MARHASRVRETSTTTGTGTISLAGAVGGFRTFVAGVGTGKPARYTIRNRDVPTEWESGMGVVTDASPDTLSRLIVVRSSNGDSLVSFSAGTKDVFCSIGEEELNRLDQLPLRVKVATTANITLSGTQTIDGVSAGVGDRVLVKDQSTASQNGLYLVASGSWTRAIDFYAGDPASCSVVLVDQGTVGANSVWFCTSNSGSDVVGTDSLAFSRIDSRQLLGASAGILCSDGSGGINARTLTAPAAGISVSNGTGASGNPTLALANDLAAAEGLSGTGMIARTASDTWTTRTIAGGTGVTVTNGDGVSGAPSISIGQAVATSSTVQFANIGVQVAPISQRGIYAAPTCTGAGAHIACGFEALTSGTAPSILVGIGGGVYTQASGANQTYADARCVWANSATKQQVGDTITVNTGVYVSDQTAGTTNYGLYTNAGNNYLGDDLMIGTTTAPTTNSGKSLMFGASGGNVTPGASTCGLFGKTVTQVEVFAVDSAANVTQLSPHPDKVMDGHADLCRELGVEPAKVPWGYESEQAAAGIVTRVDLAAVVRLVEMLASDKLGKPVRLLVEESVTPTMDWAEREAAADAQHAVEIASHQRHLDAFRDEAARWTKLPPLLRAGQSRPMFAGGKRPEQLALPKPSYLEKLGA